MRQGVEGDDLMLQFIIGIDGRAEPASVRIVDGHYRTFMLAARDAVIGARFQPARVGACPVRQLVKLPMRFGVERGGTFP